MRYEKEFREAKPETIGEKDLKFDLSNYIDWLECEYEELKQDKNSSLTTVVGSYSEKDMDNAYDKGFKDAMIKYRKD